MFVEEALALTSLADVTDIVGKWSNTDEQLETLLLERRDEATRLHTVTLFRVPLALRAGTWTRGLRQLYFRGMGLGDAGAVAIAQSLGCIETLSISGCGLCDASAHALAALLRATESLVYLNVSDNSFADPLLYDFGDAVAENTTLRTLFINNVHASRELFDSLLLALERHPTLERVDISDCAYASHALTSWSLAANHVLRDLHAASVPYSYRFFDVLCENDSILDFSTSVWGSSDSYKQSLRRLLEHNQSMRTLWIYNGDEFLSDDAVVAAFVANTSMTSLNVRRMLHPDVARALRRNMERRYVYTYWLLCCCPQLRTACGAREIYVRIATAVLETLGDPPMFKDSQ